ncbi:50S ribosomal protein L13 [Candidatus Gottesmanbacteria bacterium]|nr:50S ribosomal protein L13 [Candidatus Gottesmanbacteria bacterium]
MKLTQSTKKKDIRRVWHQVDLKDKILGRISTRIAFLLLGKAKPYFVPYLDCGDYVVVVNASLVRVSGDKPASKIYTSYSGYPGGLKKKTFSQLLQENPTRIIKEAVAGMLPKNKLRASMLKRLYVFSEADHPYKDKLKIAD